MASMKTSFFYLCAALLFLLISSSSSAISRSIFSGDPSAYEMLEQFDFPKGILPEGVQGYELSPDGGFAVYLVRECEFEVDGGYLLSYKTKITGRVEQGSLRELRGVRVKILFVWFGINEVMRSGDSELDFYVGPLFASFPISNFEVSPKCRCGFNCVASLISDS